MALPPRTPGQSLRRLFVQALVTGDDGNLELTEPSVVTEIPSAEPTRGARRF